MNDSVPRLDATQAPTSTTAKPPLTPGRAAPTPRGTLRRTLRDGSLVDYDVYDAPYPCNDAINRQMAEKRAAERSMSRSRGASSETGGDVFSGLGRSRPASAQPAGAPRDNSVLRELEKDIDVARARKQEARVRERDEAKKSVEYALQQERAQVAQEKQKKLAAREEMQRVAADRARESEQRAAAKRAKPSVADFDNPSNVFPMANATNMRPSTATPALQYKLETARANRDTNSLIFSDEHKSAVLKERLELQQFWLKQMKTRKERDAQDKQREVQLTREANTMTAGLVGRETTTVASLIPVGGRDSDATRKSEALRYRDAVRKQIEEKQAQRSASLHAEREKAQAEARQTAEIAAKETARERERKTVAALQLRDAMKHQLDARSQQRSSSARHADPTAVAVEAALAPASLITGRTDNGQRREAEIRHRDAVRRQIEERQAHRTASLHAEREKAQAEVRQTVEAVERDVAREREAKAIAAQQLRLAMQHQLDQRSSARRSSSARQGPAAGTVELSEPSIVMSDARNDPAAKRAENIRYRDEIRKQIEERQAHRTASQHAERDKARADVQANVEATQREVARERERKAVAATQLRDAMQHQLDVRSDQRSQQRSSSRLGDGTPAGSSSAAAIGHGVLWRCPVTQRLLPPEDFNVPRSHQALWPATTGTLL